MRWLVDECVHRVIVDNLRSAGHDVSFVTDETPSSPDRAILHRADAERRILLTQDLDFGEMLFRERLVPGSGVILLRARFLSADFLWRRLQFAMDELGELLTERYTVIENSRIRTRPLR